MNKTLLAMLVGGVLLSNDGVAYAGFFDWFGDNKKENNIIDPKVERVKEIAQQVHRDKTLLIDGFKPVIDANGKYYFDANVFNTNYASAAAVVYDKDGNIVDVQKIDGAGPSTSIVGFYVDDVTIKNIEAMTDDYKWNDVRDAVNSKKTELKNIEVPVGGRVEISKTSEWAAFFNIMDMMANGADLLMPTDLNVKLKYKILFAEFTKAGLIELMKNPTWLRDPNVDIGFTLKFILSTALGIAKNPDIYDARTALGKITSKNELGKVLKPISKTVEKPVFLAESVAVTLNTVGRVVDVNRSKNNDESLVIDQSDIVKAANYIATGSYDAPREPDPSLAHKFSLASMNNSHMGSAYPFYMDNTPTYTSEDAVKGFKDSLIATNGSSEKNTNTNPVLSGQQQSTFLNTQPFSSTDWIVKEGASNNFVKTESFGSVIAPNNNPMSALNKPMAVLNNANATKTVMERTFTIPTGVKNVSLGFNANFITNEFPAFVGSQFNDNVKVEIVTASGNLYEINNPIPFKESLNASQLTPVTGLPSPMQPDGGQTGFKPIDVTNIPVAGGGAVTVRVTVENTGDQLYPSAALISDTQAKPR